MNTADVKYNKCSDNDPVINFKVEKYTWVSSNNKELTECLMNETQINPDNNSDHRKEKSTLNRRGDHINCLISCLAQDVAKVKEMKLDISIPWGRWFNAKLYTAARLAQHLGIAHCFPEHNEISKEEKNIGLKRYMSMLDVQKKDGTCISLPDELSNVEKEIENLQNEKRGCRNNTNKKKKLEEDMNLKIANKNFLESLLYRNEEG